MTMNSYCTIIVKNENYVTFTIFAQGWENVNKKQLIALCEFIERNTRGLKAKYHSYV